MAKRRGNPNWGKADSGPVLPVITEFEKITAALNLVSEEHAESPELREWARRNKNSKYIPEPLLEAWGFEIESDWQ